MYQRSALLAHFPTPHPSFFMLAGGWCGESKIAAKVLHEVLDFGHVFCEIFNGLSWKKAPPVYSCSWFGGILEVHICHLYFYTQIKCWKIMCKYIYTYTDTYCVYLCAFGKRHAYRNALRYQNLTTTQPWLTMCSCFVPSLLQSTCQHFLVGGFNPFEKY